MDASITIREATPADAPRLLDIYRPFVESTVVSFEMVAPTVDEFSRRIETARSRWQWLLAEEGERCLGYAYGSSHRDRPAYQWSVEVSAYVDANHHQRGIGQALYARLFEDLAAMGFCNAFAGITLPNDASVALHRRAGFKPIGIFRRVGHKFGRWHDVGWYQRMLRESPPSVE